MDTEQINISYADSLNHKAEALDLNTTKEVILEHLISPYRWVREAAAKHPVLTEEIILSKFQTHENLLKKECFSNIEIITYKYFNDSGVLDRYVLKGLILNPNCTSVIRDKITVLLEDEEKYPTEWDQYEILSTQSRPQYFITGEMSNSVDASFVAEALISSDSWWDYIESTESDWRDWVRDDNYGPTTLVDCVIYPDNENETETGKVELDDFYPKESGPVEGGSNYGQVGTFLDFRSVIDKGSWINYVFELEYEFNPKYLKPIFNEYSSCGIISYYEYDNKDTGDFVDDIEGEYEESRPSMGGDISLFANTKKGLKQIYDFEFLKEEMVMKNINITDLSEVTEFLDKKFS